MTTFPLYPPPEPPHASYAVSQYIETDTGNKVSRQAVISGSQNIVLGGKSVVKDGCILRGDLRRSGGGSASVVLAIGKWCTLERNTIIRPPWKVFKGVLSYYPVRIGDHTYIGADTVIEASSIGNGCYIGDRSIIGKGAQLKDYVMLLPDTVVAPGQMLTSFAIYGGSPAVWQQEMPESCVDLSERFAKQAYYRFEPAAI